MAIADRNGLPVAIRIASTAPHEVTLVERTLDVLMTRAPVHRVISDRTYDSDRLDTRLQVQHGIMRIAPHRATRRHAPPDGRALRRYRRRWKLERLFAWLHNFRRIVTRYERHADPSAASSS